MIQGKESLVGLNDSNYLLEKIPILEPTKNKKTYNITYSLSNNTIKGTATAQIVGFGKSSLFNVLSQNASEENEIWKSIMVTTNEKINAKVVTKTTNEYSDDPTVVQYDFSIDNWAKTVSGKTIIKPCLLFPYKESNVETEHRKFGVELNYLENYSINYTLDLPEKQP